MPRKPNPFEMTTLRVPKKTKEVLDKIERKHNVKPWAVIMAAVAGIAKPKNAAALDALSEKHPSLSDDPRAINLRASGESRVGGKYDSNAYGKKRATKKAAGKKTAAKKTAVTKKVATKKKVSTKKVATKKRAAAKR